MSAVSSEINLNLRSLELVLEQRQRVADDLVDVHFGEFRSAGAREIQQVVDDLRRAERLPRNLFQQPRFLRIALQLLGQHLRVGRNHGQRRIHFMRHAGRQQTNRRKLVRL